MIYENDIDKSYGIESKNCSELGTFRDIMPETIERFQCPNVQQIKLQGINGINNKLVQNYSEFQFILDLCVDISVDPANECASLNETMDVIESIYLEYMLISQEFEDLDNNRIEIK